MKRRDFIVGGSCFLAGCAITQFLNMKFMNTDNNSDALGFTVAAASHCNLKCKGCDTYSPLSNVEFVTYEQFSKDIDKLISLYSDLQFEVAFLGGEPLLNNELIKLIEKIYEVSPKYQSKILTNGLLLNTMDDNFWKALKKYNVKLMISKYPINIDRSIYENKAKKFKVNIFYDIVTSDKLYDLKTHKLIAQGDEVRQEGFPWSKNILDLKGQTDYIEKSKLCPHRRSLLYARGNFYSCYVHAYLKSFIEYFKVNIPITKDDYKKVADLKSIDELFEFLERPNKLCRFCKKCHDTCYGAKPSEWGFSEMKITEWT